MAENHPEEHSSPIQTPRQLIAVVALAFLVPIVLIVMISQLVMSGAEIGRNNPAMSDEAIARRLKPVGEVVVDPNQPMPVQVAAAPAAVPVVPAAKSVPAGKAAAGKGKSVYDATCMTCHGPGLAGAPKAGDKAAWAPRLKAGVGALYASSLKGKSAMPPKGGNMTLSDADVKAAVDYMVGLVK